MRRRQEAARERVGVLAKRTDGARARRRGRARELPGPRRIVDLRAVHLGADGVVLEDQTADTAAPRATPAHGGERGGEGTKLVDHPAERIERRHAADVHDRARHQPPRLPAHGVTLQAPSGGAILTGRAGETPAERSPRRRPEGEGARLGLRDRARRHRERPPIGHVRPDDRREQLPTRCAASFFPLLCKASGSGTKLVCR